MHKEVSEFLSKKLPQSKASFEERENGDHVVYVDKDSILPVCEALKKDSHLDFKVLQVITGTDYLEKNEIEITYVLSNFFKGHDILLKTKVPRESPKLKSVTSVWSSANWQERECYDMLGVVFEGHPDPRRILCPDDWEGFPLRKDYKVAEKYKHMTINPEDKMNFPERGFAELQKEAFASKGQKLVRPEVALKAKLFGE